MLTELLRVIDRVCKRENRKLKPRTGDNRNAYLVSMGRLLLGLKIQNEALVATGRELNFAYRYYFLNTDV
ncbi:hypothetical protein CWO13_01080 [Vibrio sp. ZF 223]|nr:hypothetical protein CWO13_01080 [Vibrio sp. ZF 223]